MQLYSWSLLEAREEPEVHEEDLVQSADPQRTAENAGDPEVEEAWIWCNLQIHN